MLSIGPGSACDVCLEPFGLDIKAPCSIQCGHVFCVDCLNHISRPSCPLCRTSFDPRAIVKLHIDLDNMRSLSSPAVRATCPTAAEQEARRLQEAIASVANEGTTEPRLRQLIADTKAFLTSQQRHLFSDLRVSHRMIAYLCEVKTTLRSQNQAVDALKEQLSQLGIEKADLEHRIEYLVGIRKDEKETALAVEMSLRDHCSRAHAAYETMVERYNFVVSCWMRLNEEVRRLRLPGESRVHEPGVQTQVIDVPFASETRPSLPDYLPSHHQMKLKEAAVADPESFLISPLPEFTGRLPSALDSFVALPEVDDDLKKPKGGLYEDASSCGATGHPFSCRCVPFPMFPDMPQSIVAAVQPSSSRRTSFTDRAIASNQLADTAPIAVDPELPFDFTPSGRDAFGHRVPRTPRSLSQPSRPSSVAPTRSPSPMQRPMPPILSHSRISSPLDPSVPSGHAGSAQARTGGLSRLHDLLQDASGMSSSLPNMSINFPASATRDSHRSREKLGSRSPSHSRSSSLHRSSLPSHQNGENHSASEPVPTAPSLSAASNPPIFSASVVSMVREKAQQERQRAEKQGRERRRSEKECEKLDQERERPSRGRPRIDVELSRTPTAPVRGSPSPLSTSQQEPTSARPNIYSQRTSSYGKSSSSLIWSSTNAHRQTTNAIPALGTTRV